MRMHWIVVGLGWIGLGCVLSGGCGAQRTADFDPEGVEGELAACAFSVTNNTYDGPNFWGTITVKNGGPSATGYSVEFDVPSGVHCTNDAVPAGGAHLHHEVANSVSVEEAVAIYRQDPDVLYAEPNYIVKTTIAPNDARFGELWGLNNIGQAGAGK